MSSRRQDALDYHSQGKPGKIEVVPTKPSVTQRDLSLAYSPGVAEPSREIAGNRELVGKYTARSNLVGVITNGTAVLGLGDIGPYAAKPVMEGKAMLFKKFAGIDVFDIEIAEKDPEKLVETICRLEPTFGGINLEDIRAPECFYVEEQLRARMSIPVFHDDQHGTAIITGAALLNACEIVGKPLADIQVVCSGAGAAAVRCMELWVSLGVRRENILMLDRLGVVYEGRTEEMDPYKGAFAKDTPMRTLREAIVGKDVFVGLSVGNIVDAEMLKTMASNPIIFALANPDPEVPYEVAIATRPDAIVATGRSDYPNQVNNVLGYPYIFRGALDVEATVINEPMKIAATRALAQLAKIDVPDRVMEAYERSALKFGREYIIPKPFDERVLYWVAPAVAQAAMTSGVARKELDLVEYRERLMEALSPTRLIVRKIFNIAKLSPQRIVFPEGESDKILKAATIARDEQIAKPILLGRPDFIRARAKEMDLDLSDITLINPIESPDLERYTDVYWVARRRKGVTRYNASKAIARERKLFGMLMVNLGDADGCVAGLTSSYPETIRPALQIIGLAPGYARAAGMYMMLKGTQVLFCTDTTVNENPDAATLAEIAIASADAVRDLGIEPRIAMLSYSNFGSARGEEPARMAKAVQLVRNRRPDLMIDGEMQADVALEPLLREEWSFSDLKGSANVLVFPSLDAGNIAYKLLASFGQAEAIGPMLLGMRKPVTVLQRNSSVETIVSMCAITAASAVRHNAGSFG
ncbi:NADP-dependent malic enzyme [Labilithrix luteola]|uniref:NADP-dependent malic enzyme n=1 Tax=Labilithrix luteola TaxID=1391654 RepID=A0A0K1QGI0_9BACT|nr:NADP-dependent malic enzyme [Labilithrix luteola]AKV04752.1 NADP-dependent malic enzyme [Labilithrix luteola]